MRESPPEMQGSRTSPIQRTRPFDPRPIRPTAPSRVRRTTRRPRRPPGVYPEEATMLQKYPFYAYIPAKDVGRARKFYEGKMGLKPQQEFMGGVTYKFGDHTAGFLYPAGDSAGTSRASQA